MFIGTDAFSASPISINIGIESDSNGEIFNMYKVSAAHKSYPLGTKVRVTNLENGKSIKLVINDRGPFVKGRIIDLSYKAARKLDFVNHGTTKVRIDVIRLGDNKYYK